MNDLTELTIKQAKPKTKQYKLFDGGGMFLLVHPNGSKYWRMKFSFERKSKLASFGVWPDVSLKDIHRFSVIPHEYFHAFQMSLSKAFHDHDFNRKWINRRFFRISL